MFRQVEALNAIYLDLGFERSLPATRGWAASPDFLAVLIRHVSIARPAVIVECGSGVSTLILARALQINGHGRVYSLEHLPEHAAATQELLVRHNVDRFATIVEAPLRRHRVADEERTWYSVDSLPESEIDMLVIDGPPWTVGRLARYPAGPLLFPRLTGDGVVFLDDANRVDERAVLERWRDEYPGLTQQKIECEKGCVTLRKR